MSNPDRTLNPNRIFSPQETRSISGMTGKGKKTLEAWILREQLKLEKEKAPGEWREFTLRDLIRVCTWAEIDRAGLAPLDLAKAIKAAEENLFAAMIDPALLETWAAVGKFLVLAGPTPSDVGMDGLLPHPDGFKELGPRSNPLEPTLMNREELAAELFGDRGTRGIRAGRAEDFASTRVIIDLERFARQLVLTIRNYPER